MSVDKDSLKAGAELLEVVIDTFITPEGLVKDIPVVGSIFSLAEACNTFRNKRFAKRVAAFLTSFSLEEFEKFKKAIADKSNEDLGEEILSVIENLEKEIQVDMIARATRMHIALLEEGHSSKSIKYILDRNIHIIKQLDSHLLRGLHTIYKDQNSVGIRSVEQTLANLGLLRSETVGIDAGGGISLPQQSFLPNEEGRIFYNLIVCGDD
ncbi:hypothetical protein [Acinetobacter baumannii]|uniref:hypothetical protein n=1 Tax=Acinetobacter baumannii TaxID=470 RepID=UPI00244C0BB1|nr:hypothetical protein [Acinetobacter baumannii]MDH2570348.1 hypothetical protein [Acinetobacter baumannii]